MRQDINVASQFSVLPAGRYKRDGQHTGEHFRELLKSYLESADAANIEIVVDFDGVLGVGSSFLDESFGGLVRSGVLGADEFAQKIKIVSNTHPDVIEKINRYVQDAKME